MEARYYHRQLHKLEQIDHFLPINFDEIWNLHPETQHVIVIHNKAVKQPRYTQSYMRDYNYSGTSAKAKELPKELEPLYEQAKLYDPRFNQMLVNWYENGAHYIGAHSDDTKQLIADSPILSVSYGAPRKFRIRDKRNKSIVQDIMMQDNTAVVMKDDFQKCFTHEIVKIGGTKGLQYGRRINVTFRCFKEREW